MDEFISREETIKRIKEVYCAGCNSYNGVRCRACGTGDAIDIIDDFPAADVAPVRHARWVHEHISEGYAWVICSECEAVIHKILINKRLNYCPNCGAKMDGGDGNER